MTTDQARLPCSIDELRTLFLFEKLSEDQLTWLCREGYIESFPAGPVYTEGDPATHFYVLLDGEVVLYRRVGGDDVEVTRTDGRGAYGGAFMAYIEQGPQVYNNSMRATGPARFFVLSAACFGQLMRDWFPMPVHLLEGLFFGTKNTQLAVGQRERLLALGSLSAGLTHELNNPAAAAVRATAALRERVAGMRHKLGMIAAGTWEPAMLDTLIRLQEDAVERVAKAPKLGPIEASDAEDVISDWLQDRGISDGWELAPVFVQAGLDTGWLDRAAVAVGDQILDGAVRWLRYTVETELLMSEIEDATVRVSSLVTAAKQYSQLDRAPYQVVDVHTLLDSTLVMLGGKIGNGIKVVKDYDRGLPPIPAYGRAQPSLDQPDRQRGGRHERVGHPDRSDLPGPGPSPGGVRRYRARGAERDPAADFRAVLHHQAGRRGTGLGLDISWRIIVNKHHGDLRVESVPGDTRFLVRLPLTASSRALCAPDVVRAARGPDSLRCAVWDKRPTRC